MVHGGGDWTGMETLEESLRWNREVEGGHSRRRGRNGSWHREAPRRLESRMKVGHVSGGK